MGTTNYGLSGNILLWTGSATAPQWLAIGNGSATGDPAVGSLYGESGTTRAVYSTRDITIANQITFTFAYTASQMSGIVLREVGLCGGSAVGSQNVWYRSGFPGVTFDGTNELVVDLTMFNF